MSLGAGDQLGDYRILSRLGAGAYGEVFEAEHVITRRRDAIKILFDGRLRIPEEEERFLREIRVQASLHHPNIAAVYHAFWTPHGLALVMELAPGEPLSALLSRGRIPLDQGVRLVLGTLAGLAYAHSQGVVHRDIKPENIIVAPDGSIKLTDFGLARSVASPRITQGGAAAGSPCYMSPEQALGTAAVDSRSDTYSAGVVLYEIATGRLPFTADTAFAVMLAHRNTPAPAPIELDPAIGPELNQVILKALNKDPDKRFQSGSEFQAAIESLPAFAPSPAPPAAARTSGFWRSPIFAAAAVCSLAVAAAGYTALHRAHKAPKIVRNQPVGSEPVRSAPVEPPPPANPPLPAPEETALPLAPAAEPDPPPVRTAHAKAPKRTPEPPLERVHVIGSVDDDSASRAGPPPEPKAPVEKPGSMLAVTAAPPAAPAMPIPQAKPAPAPEEEEATAPAKRRNVMIRAFHHVFRSKRETPTSPSTAHTPGQPVVPQH